MKTMRFLVFLIFCANTPLWGAEITGRVIDVESRMPIASVRVSILNTDFVTQTDGDGHFAFADLMPGSYTVVMTHVAYEVGRRTVQVVGAAEVFIALSHRTLSLDEFSVIADPIGASDIHKNPAYATVITRESFEGRETSLPDVLAEATGVHVKRLGGLGTFSTLSLRGSSADQVEVYLDGILLNTAFGGGVDLSNLPLAHVGQIEVYRGAGASGNGLGGTVHVRTRRMQRQWFHGIRGSWGAFDTRLLSGMCSRAGLGSRSFSWWLIMHIAITILVFSMIMARNTMPMTMFGAGVRITITGLSICWANGVALLGRIEFYPSTSPRTGNIRACPVLAIISRRMHIWMLSKR